MSGPKAQTEKAEIAQPKEVADDDPVTVLLIRLLYVTYYMANGVLQPFLPMYYQSLGFGGQIIGLLGSITPATTFLAGPIWGVVSDTLQTPFSILYGTIALTLLGQILSGVVSDPYSLMGLVCIKSIFNAPIRPLIDSAVLHQLKDRSQFGKMRLWAMIGAGLGTSMAGYFVDGGNIEGYQWGEPTNLSEVLVAFYGSLSGYRFLFFIHIALHIPVFISLRSFQVDHKKDKNPLASNWNKVSEGIESTAPKNEDYTSQGIILSVAKNPEAMIFFAMVYAMGVSGGIADNFTYARFREVGSNGTVMGNSRLFSSGAGAIMFWYSGAFSSMLGTEAVILLCLFTVSLRFGLYSIMNRPLYAYIGESLRGFTFGCFWSSATVYANQIAPEGARATMLLLLNGSYNGIGRSTGALLGGKVQDSIGTALIFQYGAIIYFAMACFFAVYKSRQVASLSKDDPEKKTK